MNRTITQRFAPAMSGALVSVRGMCMASDVGGLFGQSAGRRVQDPEEGRRLPS